MAGKALAGSSIAPSSGKHFSSLQEELTTLGEAFQKLLVGTVHLALRLMSTWHCASCPSNQSHGRLLVGQVMPQRHQVMPQWHQVAPSHATDACPARGALAASHTHRCLQHSPVGSSSSALPKPLLAARQQSGTGSVCSMRCSMRCGYVEEPSTRTCGPHPAAYFIYLFASAQLRSRC